VGGSSVDSSSSLVTSSWMATRYSVSEMSVLLHVSVIGFSVVCRGTRQTNR
jgi:hypothetical protein